MNTKNLEEDGFAYGPIVLDHFQNPRNAGQMSEPDYVGEAGNPVCGDRMRLFLKMSDGKVAEARFLTFGCSVAIAASSILTELVQGRTVEELGAMRNSEIVNALVAFRKKRKTVQCWPKQPFSQPWPQRSNVNEFAPWNNLS